MNLSERIKNIREVKRIKQIEIADKLGMEQSNYTRLEKRGSKLTYEQIEKIAEALEVPIKYLLFGEQEPNTNDNEEKIKKLENEIKDLKEILRNERKLVSTLEKLKKVRDNLYIHILQRMIDGLFLFEKHSKKDALEEIKAGLESLIKIIEESKESENDLSN